MKNERYSHEDESKMIQIVAGKDSCSVFIMTPECIHSFKVPVVVPDKPKEEE